jgi:large subunit ribosomal protein L7A
MLDELKKANKIIGIKQSTRAVAERNAQKVFIAKDAEERIVRPIVEACAANSIKIEYVDTMEELGKACGIQVGAATAVIPKN